MAFSAAGRDQLKKACSPQSRIGLMSCGGGTGGSKAYQACTSGVHRRARATGCHTFPGPGAEKPAAGRQRCRPSGLRRLPH
jgi:hypothetical protein